MNKLTKEECLEAVKGLRLLERAENFEKGKNIAPQTKCDVIRQLINEHFDNPPLKFEELEVGMWVWDNKWKTYYTIKRIRNKNIYARYVRFVVDPYTDESEVDCGWMGVFEENRFYRKEVKHD